MPPKPLTRTPSIPFNPFSARSITPSPLSCKRSAPHIRRPPPKSPPFVRLYGLCTSPRSSMIGKQQTTEERSTRFRWEHLGGSRACGEEGSRRLRRPYIRERRLQRSGRGRTNRLSRSVSTTLPPMGCGLQVRLGRRRNLMLTCQGWPDSYLSPRIYAHITLLKRTFGSLVSSERIATKSFVGAGTERPRLAWWRRWDECSLKPNPPG